MREEGTISEMHTPQSPPGEITVLLHRWTAGDRDAREQLVESVYPELRRIAQRRMRGERKDHTLQPTALISEFFLGLAKTQTIAWSDRAHFLSVAAQAMRRMLIDYARSHNAGKRGRGAVCLRIEDLHLAGLDDGSSIIEFDESIQQLSREDPRMGSIAEMRCFGGLTHPEIAQTLGIDERTVKRDWQVAKAWLTARLKKGSAHVKGGMGTS
jgi:RNA polymerase sigma-70 factor (ECF subfamily)